MAIQPKTTTAVRHRRSKGNRQDPGEMVSGFQELIAATIRMDFQSALNLVRQQFPGQLESLGGDPAFSNRGSVFSGSRFGKGPLLP